MTVIKQRTPIDGVQISKGDDEFEKVLISLVMVLMVSVLLGCFTEKSESFTINSAIEKLESGGIEILETSTVLYQMIGAEDGIKLHLAEENVVELYIDGGNITKSFFSSADNGFNVSNLYIFIHSEESSFKDKIKSILEN